MKVLCLGFSNILRRRVLPALQALDAVGAIEVASRRGAPPADQLTSKVSRTHADFERALGESDADWVYVSTVNSEHEPWARRALEAGFHVLVDKPAFLSLDAARELTRSAHDHGRVLGEATVFTDHPQIALCRDLFSGAGSRPARVVAVLSMPPLDEANFRYRRELGGGALWDLGPYAVSVGRALFEAPATSVSSVVNAHAGAGGVETSFSMLLAYSEGRSVVGHFGFDTEYRNECTVLGRGLSVSFQRAFTIPPDLENRLEVRRGNEDASRNAPAADPFACFLGRFCASLADPRGAAARRFAEDLLEDARTLSQLRASAGAESCR